MNVPGTAPDAVQAPSEAQEPWVGCGSAVWMLKGDRPFTLLFSLERITILFFTRKRKSIKIKLNKGSKTATETEMCGKKKWIFLEEIVTLYPEHDTPRFQGFKGFSRAVC